MTISAIRDTRWSLLRIINTLVTRAASWLSPGNQNFSAPQAAGLVPDGHGAEPCVLFHDKRRRLRNLLFRDFVIYFDRHLVLARLQASHRQGLLHRELVTMLAEVL
jgi:hypothetical protein